MNITKAVILAAGEGNRMRPLTYTRPKVMLPIANKPILEHLMIEMKKAGVREFVFIVGYHDDQIRNYFSDGGPWDVQIQYCDQRRQQGTADALKMAKGLFDERFLVANGDVIINCQDIQLVMSHPGNVISAIELPGVAGLGVIESREGQVLKIHEKLDNPPSHLVNAGLYVLTPDIFDAIEKTEKSPRGEYDITDSIQIMIDGGNPMVYQEIGFWPFLDYPWDLLNVNERFLARMDPHRYVEIEDNATLKGAVSIGKGTVVRSGSYIIGPVIIGQNCDIGPNCFIRSTSAIGNNCHIGAAVEIENSIIMSGTKIPHLSYVGDSVIGENCNLGAGTKIANLILDKGNIIVNDVDTHRRKLGAIIGDNVQTGINSSVNVGALVGNGAFVGPGAFAQGTISPGSKIF
ncbi:MAG TPA: bifunctional sugar-1-phosphate nucleotidylyltransferase/acetyltransferase [Dehalococcoidales bacterium]